MMNEKWWVANKAKTLLDKGDTVKAALARWDRNKGKKSQDLNFTDIDNTLIQIKTAAAGLRQKANATLHKETIVYLSTYMKNTDQFRLALNKANGDEIS